MQERLREQQRDRSGRDRPGNRPPRPPPPPLCEADSAAAEHPEVLDLVRRMCDHYGWMRAESLGLHRIDPRTSKSWREQLPEVLRGDERAEDLALRYALRTVRRERKEAGVPLPDRKNMIGKPPKLNLKQQRTAASERARVAASERAREAADRHGRIVCEADAEAAASAPRNKPLARRPYMCVEWEESIRWSYGRRLNGTSAAV